MVDDPEDEGSTRPYLLDEDERPFRPDTDGAEVEAEIEELEFQEDDQDDLESELRDLLD